MTWFRQTLAWANVESAYGVTYAYNFYQVVLNTGSCIEQNEYYTLNIHLALDTFINKHFSNFN